MLHFILVIGCTYIYIRAVYTLVRNTIQKHKRIASIYVYILYNIMHNIIMFTVRSWRVRRPGPGEPVRRRVHQRPAVAQPHTAEDRRDGRGRRAAVRDIQTAARVARLRVENTEPVPGDGQHQARRDRRQQAQGGHAGRGAAHRRVQDGEPGHIQLGNTRQVYNIYDIIYDITLSCGYTVTTRWWR